MFENGLDRVITYKFELPKEGEYTVEVGFASPWGNSVPADLYLNGELAAEGIMATSDECGAATAIASPVDGFITVEDRTDMPTLNMAYIIISKVPAPEPENEPETAPADTETDTSASSAEQSAPETGLALAVIPAAAALVIAGITKRR